MPFLAYNGAHGALTTLGEMDSGIEIFMQQLSSVDIAEDGKTVTIGGGTNSKVVVDALWEAGKQAGTSTDIKRRGMSQFHTDLRQLLEHANASAILDQHLEVVTAGSRGTMASSPTSSFRWISC